MSRGRLVPRTSRRMRVRATGSHDFVAAPQRAAGRGGGAAGPSRRRLVWGGAAPRWRTASACSRARPGRPPRAHRAAAGGHARHAPRASRRAANGARIAGGQPVGRAARARGRSRRPAACASAGATCRTPHRHGPPSRRGTTFPSTRPSRRGRGGGVPRKGLLPAVARLHAPRRAAPPRARRAPPPSRPAEPPRGAARPAPQHPLPQTAAPARTSSAHSSAQQVPADVPQRAS